MILCIALLVFVIGTGALVLWSFWEHEQVQGLDSIVEHQQAMQAIGPRRWT